MKGEVIINVSVELPWAEKVFTFSHSISRMVAEDSLVPLPRDREINPFSAAETHQMIKRRNDLAESLGRMVSSSILSSVEFCDTVNGYRKVIVK